MQPLIQLVKYFWSRPMATPPHQSNQVRDLISDLPPDMYRFIFSIAKESLLEIAQVSKKWKEMAYDQELYKMIVPSFRFGEDAWKKHIGIPEKETLLPLCIFKDMARGEGYLTWVTETVQVTKEDGTVEEIILDSGLKLESLVQNPKEGHKTGYAPSILGHEEIKKNRTRKRSHWVWIQKEPIGKNEYFENSNISGLIDTLMTVFMEKIRSGKSCFEDKWIGVNEYNFRWRVCVCFTASGLEVSSEFDYVVSNADIAFLVARKSFGR